MSDYVKVPRDLAERIVAAKAATPAPADASWAVDSEMVLRACNAYDRSQDSDICHADFPAMHAALNAAIATIVAEVEALRAEVGTLCQVCCGAMEHGESDGR